MAEGPPLIDLQDIDSAFQLTEHLKALHYALTHPAESNIVNPIDLTIARQLTSPPPHTSRDIWLYELGRFLIQKTNAIIVALFSDDPPCSAQTCPEMRASEWQYLCAVHDPPKSCAAIDYCCHTLDGACNTLASPKNFPSRLGLGSGGAGANAQGSDKLLQNQLKEIKNIFRRVYRIYAHAWFSHREMFWRVEAKTGLYTFFKTVCDEYSIIEQDSYTIPAEAEGLAEPETPIARISNEPMSLFARDHEEQQGVNETNYTSHVVSMGDTTKRHRHTLSDLSSSPSNIIQEEEGEDEHDGEDGEASLPEPGLNRQPTALRDEEHEEEKSASELEDGSSLGVMSDETTLPGEEAYRDDADGNGETEVTIIETTGPGEEDTTLADEDGQVKEEPVEVNEQSATQSEAAGQTVGD